MSRMQRHFMTVYFVILLFLGTSALFSTPGNAEKQGMTEFLEYLNSQKETLGYKNIGVLEHADTVEIRIHCNDAAVGKILAETGKYGYKKLTIGRVSEDNVTVVVIFLKPGAVAVEPPEEEIKEPITEPTKEPQKAKCPKKVKVQVREITPKTFMEYKYFEKPAAAAKEIEVISPAAGKIAEVFVNTGDGVTTNQVLCRLDAKKINQEIARAQDDLARWKRILKRREGWKVRSASAEEQAKRGTREAQTRINSNSEALKNLEIKSPDNGTVIFVADKETAVEKGGTAAKIINLAVMKIDLPTEDQDLFKDEVILSFKELGLSLIGKVEKKDNSLRLIIDNTDLRLSEGATASFRVLLQKHENAVVIDPKLLLEDEKGKYVYIVANGKFAKKTYLELGPVEEGSILVRSGLSLENMIITSGIECLEDGKKIKIVTQLPKPLKVTPPPEEEKKIEIPDPDKHALKLSLGLGYNLMGEEVFQEVYGKSLVSGYVGITYSFSSALEMYFATSLIRKKGTFTDFPDEVTLTLAPIYVGGRFKFKATPRIKPYLGAAVAVYNVKETTATIKVPYKTQYGVSLNGGTSMNFTSRLGLFLDLKYDLVKIPVDNTDTDLDFSGIRLTLGLTFSFKI